MTTDNGGGSAPAGNSAGVSQGADSGGNATALAPDAGFFSGLQDADNRDLAAKKGWDKAKSPDVVITSYRELESRLGNSVVLPTEQSPQEDYDKLYAKLGKPEKPEGYSFKLPSGLPENFPYDDAFATEYRGWAHAAGLTPRQAQSVHDSFVKRASGQMEAGSQQVQTKVQTAHGELVKTWGPPDSDTYKHAVRMGARALQKLGLESSFKQAGLLTPAGEITDPKVGKALATIGEGLFKDDTVHGEPGFHVASNPWKDGQENLQEQGRIAKENPDLARSLIVAAGKDPKKVLWTGQ